MLWTMGAQVNIIKDCHKREKLLHWWPKACHNLFEQPHKADRKGGHIPVGDIL